MKAILIGGTSHTGKTTLAHAIAEQLSWRVLSTDYLARHPGRPWRTDGSEVPPHVIDHFASLTVDELLADVLTHYRKVWETVEGEIRRSDGVVVEGSAVLPQLAAPLLSKEICGYWLTLDAGILRNRMSSESSAGLRPGNRHAIEKFILRAIAFDKYITDEALKLGLTILNADEPTVPLAGRIMAGEPRRS